MPTPFLDLLLLPCESVLNESTKIFEKIKEKGTFQSPTIRFQILILVLALIKKCKIEAATANYANK